MKPFHTLIFGSSDKAFGHADIDGLFGYADPDQQIG